MLTKRQREILEYLEQKKDRITTAKELSDNFNISLRTIHSEFKSLKDDDYSSIFVLESLKSKGNRLVIKNNVSFSNLIEESKVTEKNDLSDRNNRINRIIFTLIDLSKGISLYHLEERLYVSRTTLMEDLKYIRLILQKYNLELINSRETGVQIKGDERNIRELIVREKVDLSLDIEDQPKSIHGHLSPLGHDISDIVISILNQNQYRILNISLQNLIIHLDISIYRIKNGFSIEEKKKIDFIDTIDKEIKLSREIMGECERRFNIKVSENEIYRIASYISGKANYNDESYITEEIESFVLEGLQTINDKFGFNLVDNLQLRISLALHILPLRIRMRHNMQIKNELIEEIRKNYQLAFDIASLFCSLLQDREGVKVNEDEIAFFALYFNNAIDDIKSGKGKNKMLIVTDNRRSESLLMVGRLKNRLDSLVAEINVVNPNQLNTIRVSDFDIVCITDNTIEVDNRNDFIKISSFPTDDDIESIINYINNQYIINRFLDVFSKDNFIVGEYFDKENLILEMSENIQSKEGLNYRIDEKIIDREEMGGTYYGNRVAMPHPIHPITNSTYVSVALLTTPLDWDEEKHKARVVLCIYFEKENPEIYRLWALLSPLITDKDIVNRILEEMTYENFIKEMEYCFRKSLK